MSSSNNASYDVAVVGLGAMGSATAYMLASRGYRVIAFDTYSPPHSLGSSHGESRIIREAYFESPQYVPLVRRSYELWRLLEEDANTRLLTITGGLYVGPRDGELISGVLSSSQQWNIPCELLTSDELRHRYPEIHVPENLEAILEPGVGVLQPEACISSFLQGSAARGVHLHMREKVLSWSPEGSGFRVFTSLSPSGYLAERVILTVGPWAPEILADIGVPLQVLRVFVAYFRRGDERDGIDGHNLPVHLWQLPEGTYYGMPYNKRVGMKFGRHDDGTPCTPDTIARGVTPDEIERLKSIVAKLIPSISHPVDASTCMYTMTPDQHFVVDHHPFQSGVVLACGFSGHGFKFAPVIGEILADLAIEGRTSHPIDFISLKRFTPSGAPQHVW